MKNYQVNLIYGYEEGECGIYHAFEAVAPGMEVDDDAICAQLMEQLECTEEDMESGRFNWDSMYIDLPEEVVAKIKKDAIKEYLSMERSLHSAESRVAAEGKYMFAPNRVVTDHIVELAVGDITGFGEVNGSGFYELNSFDFQSERLRLGVDIFKLVDSFTKEPFFGVYYGVYDTQNRELLNDRRYTSGANLTELKSLVWEIANTDLTRRLQAVLEYGIDNVIKGAQERSGDTGSNGKDLADYVKD